METAEQQAIFAISVTVISSFLYFILLGSIKAGKRSPTKISLVVTYLTRKLGGALLLGLLPALMAWGLFSFGPGRAGLAWGDTPDIMLWVGVASLFFLLLNLINSKNKEIQSMYPEMRSSLWGFGDLFLAAGGWVVYLTAYEYLFRGLLLFSCYEAFGLWPAIVINLALYATLHLPKGMKEALAAIPFGALICYFTLESHSIVAAIFIHAVQAVSCEVFCIWRNPEMRFKFIKNKRP